MTPASHLNWGALAPYFAALVLFLGTYLTIRAGRADKKIDATARNYDQLQEDLEGLRGELVTARARIAQLEHVDRLKDNYIANLRDHIYEERKPPPPPWPEGLTSRP